VLGFRGVTVKDLDKESCLDAIYKINYCSRVAGRVLLPICRFRCYDEKSLYEEIYRLDWLKYLSAEKTIAIDANVNHPRLRNSLYAAQITKDAICDQLRKRVGARPSIDTKNPDIQLNLYISGDWAVISFDTSGAPLHKRGYRLETVEAPLQESLAAALLLLSGYKEDDVICDPCCGSGTLLIEAAMIASNTPPGFLRKSFGFFSLPHHDQTKWLKIKNEADSKRKPLKENHFFGADNNRAAVHACKVNLRAIGFYQSIQVVQSDIREYTPEAAPDFIITNPPYGRRLDDVEHLRPLYRAIGDFMKNKSQKPAKGFVFTGSLELSKEVGLAAKRRHVLDNGGIEARLLEYDLFIKEGGDGSSEGADS
jgi:putative N6-adenine-specific DNA methylase